MYIRITETRKELTVTVDLSRLKKDAANAAELAAIMSAIRDLECAAHAIDIWCSAHIAPF